MKSIQFVSCVYFLCLILIADIACMKSRPGCELRAPSLIYFDCWHCLHEIPSSLWVVCPSSAWFWLLTLPAWNSIQTVSWCAPSLLDFDCLHEIPSRVWVVCTFSDWFWLLTLPTWNPIQGVSCVHLLWLILIANIACMKSHPDGELCAPSLLVFDCWHCLHEITSRWWVVCFFSAFFWLLTLPAWNPIQNVSWCAPSSLDFDCLHEISFRLWVMCFFFAWFWLLTLPACNPIQYVSWCAPSLLDFYCLHEIPSRMWVGVHLLRLILIACMKSHLGCELCASFLLNFDCWHCLHAIPSSMWVGVHLLCLIFIACMKFHPDCELCAPCLLDFDCWHCLYEIPFSLWVVCISSALFWLLTLLASNPIQPVSCVHLVCLILIADIVCMKSHPGCELCALPLLDFDC